MAQVARGSNSREVEGLSFVAFNQTDKHMRTCALMIVSTLSMTAMAQTPRAFEWSAEMRHSYAHKNEDSTQWDLAILKLDLQEAAMDTMACVYPLRDYPSPVARYEGNGSTLGPVNVTIADNELFGWNLAHYRDRYYAHLFTDTTSDYCSVFTLLFLTSETAFEFGNALISSRNYPHYLFTGKQPLLHGDLDWVQLTMADGRDLAIVAHRVFDLAEGRTIIAVPYRDGSVRFLQVEDSVGCFNSADAADRASARRNYAARIQALPIVQRLLFNAKVVGR